MLPENLDRNMLQNTVVQLEQAIYNHIQWHTSVIRTLACRLPCAQHDIKPNAHELCLFGQWYYEDAPDYLKKHPGFIEIGEIHHQMHVLATSLLLSENAGNGVNAYEFDTFSNIVERLRLEIVSLKRELENSLYLQDPLTGAINRIDMLPALREFQAMVKRGTQHCCLVMVDLDEFKNVNDQYGHPAGDQVLLSLVKFLKTHLRPYDKIFRYGGEEFLLAIQNISKQDCYVVIERIREGLSHFPIHIGMKQPIFVTASFGIVEMGADITVEQSIEAADKAMYAAKMAGRNNTKAE